MIARIALIHGPNLNLLGQRPTDQYGRQTLKELEAEVQAHGKTLGLEVICHQSNGEGELIDLLQAAEKDCVGVIFNPGGYSHTSVA